MRARRLLPAAGGSLAPSAAHADASGTGLGRGRRMAVRSLAVLALFAFHFMLVFVLGDALGRVGEPGELVEPGSVEARIGAEHPGETVHVVGAAAGLLIGVTGLAGLVARPSRDGSATHVGMSAIAWLVAAALVGNPDNYGGMAGPIDVAFAILALPSLAAAMLAAPWRRWRRAAIRPWMLVLAVTATPWLWYAVNQGLMQRYTWPPLADPHHQAHWFTMALVGLLIALVAAGSALAGTGWLPAASTSGLAAVAVGIASLVDARAASALAPAWAAAALVWGLVTLVVTVREWAASRRAAAPAA